MPGFIKILFARILVKVLNLFDRVLQTLGIKLYQVTLARILAGLPPEVTAEASHPLVSEPLSLVVKGSYYDDTLSLVNRWLLVQTMRGLLSSRAQISSYLKETPDIEKTPVKKPVFIIGIPRTGTTLLFRLMDLDPQFRAPRTYEMMIPGTSELHEDYKSGTRYQAALADLEFRDLLDCGPNAVNVAHEFSLDEPEECVFLLERVFMLIWHLYRLGSLREFSEWFYSRDLRDVTQIYEYHKQQMLLITHGDNSDKRLLMKSALHSIYIEGLLEVYPDARIIFPIRNLSDTIGSLCSAGEKITCALAPRDDQYGARCLKYAAACGNGMVRLSQRFESLPLEKRPIYQLNYDDLVEDPMLEVQKVYQHFGWKLNPEVEAKMKTYLEDHRQNKFGKHGYNREDYGISEKDIRREFSEYLQYFGTKAKI